MKKIISTNKLGIFFRIKKRIYTEFFYFTKHDYITGHSGYDIYIGSLFISIIYKK